MIKNRKSWLKNKYLIRIIISILLLLLWIALTLVYILTLDTALSVISYSEPKGVLKHITYSKLLKNDYVSGQFIASENNLGIVQVNFQTYFRPAYSNEDEILFQLKEQGASTWYYQSIYKDGLIYDYPNFPFGFPIIKNSKGKTYDFRITSLNGNTNNSVALDNNGTIVNTKYKFTKAELLQSKTTLISFIEKKVFNSLKNIDVIFASFIYALPFITYLFVFFFGKRLYEVIEAIYIRTVSVQKRKSIQKIYKNVFLRERFIDILISTLILSCVAIDVLYLQLRNDFIYIIIPVLFVTVQIEYKKSEKVSLSVGIFLLCISSLVLSTSHDAISEQLTAYAFLFLCAGLLQSI